jgi:SpoVK/Ycf46/Vps4 family AAA+-type ATPase
MEKMAPIHLEDAGLDIPAQRITTSCEWEDVALDPSIRQQVEDIVARAEEMHPPGFRVLFSGPSGTGKALTACLLGKKAGRPVVRIDLAAIAAEWADEMENSLAGLFEQAQREGWILYFDEADALFGKRTESRNATDRDANQQIAYLLQRIEDFPGIVILVTNLRSHLDESFARRFQAFVRFHLPDAG